jgi:hypothetical protein
MSAFPESGRSDWQKLGEIKVRFRPQADVLIIQQIRMPEGISGQNDLRGTLIDAIDRTGPVAVLIAL